MPDFGRWTSNGGDPSLNDVNRVDRFFEALSTNETAYSTDHEEADLAFLLADWRDEVRSAPVTAPVTSRDALEALNAGLGSRRRGRATLALVSTAAAAVLCIGGFGAAVYSAGPGDAFYGIRTSLFGE
ncbi:MAG: anti-sigma-D factor RsdA, partial [Mycobacterium sp.]